MKFLILLIMISCGKNNDLIKNGSLNQLDFDYDGIVNEFDKTPHISSVPKATNFTFKTQSDHIIYSQKNSLQKHINQLHSEFLKNRANTIDKERIYSLLYKFEQPKAQSIKDIQELKIIEKLNHQDIIVGHEKNSEISSITLHTNNKQDEKKWIHLKDLKSPVSALDLKKDQSLKFFDFQYNLNKNTYSFQKEKLIKNTALVIINHDEFSYDFVSPQISLNEYLKLIKKENILNERDYSYNFKIMAKNTFLDKKLKAGEIYIISYQHKNNLIKNAIKSIKKDISNNKFQSNPQAHQFIKLNIKFRGDSKDRTLIEDAYVIHNKRSGGYPNLPMMRVEKQCLVSDKIISNPWKPATSNVLQVLHQQLRDISIIYKNNLYIELKPEEQNKILLPEKINSIKTTIRRVQVRSFNRKVTPFLKGECLNASSNSKEQVTLQLHYESEVIHRTLTF